MQSRVLPDPLEVPLTSLEIGIAFKVGDIGRVVHQLMTANTCQTHEVSQVALKHVERILKRNQDIRV